MSTYNLQGGAKARASVSASAGVKHNFSKQHLRAATLFADDAQKCEAMTKQPDEEHRSRHRACVTAAVLSAVAFLEASVNELYLSAVDQDLTNLPTFDHKLFQLFGQFWENVEKYPILQKYQIALLLAGKDRFNPGVQPYQNTESLIKLRDTLVHYKPEWDNEAGQHQKLEKRLRSCKFALSPYADTGRLWFPHQCLGAGCAQWSVVTARDFSDEFCNQLGISKRTG
jgi:hypothetical protein